MPAAAAPQQGDGENIPCGGFRFCSVLSVHGATAVSTTRFSGQKSRQGLVDTGVLEVLYMGPPCWEVALLCSHTTGAVHAVIREDYMFVCIVP